MQDKVIFDHQISYLVNFENFDFFNMIIIIRGGEAFIIHPDKLLDRKNN